MTHSDPTTPPPSNSAHHRKLAYAAFQDLVRSSGGALEPDSSSLAEDAVGLRPMLEWMVAQIELGSGRAEWVDGDVHAAARLARSGTPLLLGLERDSDGITLPSWVVIHEGNDDELRVTLHGGDDGRTELLISAADLAQRLGFDAKSSQRWLIHSSAKFSTAESPNEPRTPWRRLCEIMQPDRGDLLAVAMYAVALGFLLLATPIAVQALVNFVAMGGVATPIVVVTGLLFFGLVIAGIVAAIQTWIVEILQRRLFARTVANLAARLPRVRVEVYDERHGPELVNRFFDVMTMQKAGASLLLDGLGIVLTVLVGLVLLAFYHPLLLAFDIVLVACIGLIVLGPARKGVRTAIAESYAKYQVVDWLEEITRHPNLFRSGGTRTWIMKRSDHVVEHYLEMRSRHFRVLFRQVIGALGLHAIASTALLGFGGYLVITGGLTLGQLVAAELIVTLIVASVAKMGKQLENYYDLMAATDKVGYLLDLPVENLDGVHQTDTTGTGGMELEVRGLVASRGSSPSLLEGLDFVVPSGKSLLVRGPSGSGKSTLLDLLWGLREPDHGTIRVDGHDLNSLSLEAYRTSAALLSDADIVTASVRENVRVGRTFVSELDVRRALDRVGLNGAIDRLPEGVSTVLNSRGWPLSEGEVRALQIARILADPPRLVLVSEAVLPDGGRLRKMALDALLDPEAPWTLVLTSSAPDVTSRCDLVLDLSSGRVVPSNKTQASDSDQKDSA